VNKPVVLSGATVAPGGVASLALNGASLTWNDGGQLAINLGASGASGQLTLTGAFLKGTPGVFGIALNPGAGFAAGNTYTIATFGSTNFSPGDFVVTGLPAGYTAVLSMTGTSLQVTVQTTSTVVLNAPLTVSTLAGSPLSIGSNDGTGSAARFDYPTGVAADNAGNLYVADTDNQTIRKIVVSTGAVTTLAGAAGITGSDGSIILPSHAVGVDPLDDAVRGPVGGDGTPSAALDTGISALPLAGAINQPIPQPTYAWFNNPSGVAADAAGNVYVADTLNHSLQKIPSLGGIFTLAGSPGVAGSADGTGTGARFQGPQGLAIDAGSNLYVADTNNHTIRRVVPSTGIVTTVAGLAGNSGSADGLGSLARFNYPSGVAVDSAGNLFVADTENHTIRKIAPSGMVSTVAGLAGASGWADGTGSAARFDSPSDLAVDSSGSVYVADTDNFTIRKVVPSTGAVTTLAGLAGTSGSADGSGSAVRFFHPAGIAADSSNNLYIADTDNHTIRLGLLAMAPAIQTQPQSQTVTAGNGVQFSVTASGRPAVTYQWNFNGTAINGATSSAYSLPNVQSGNAGNYTVAVSNVMGSVTSNAATLTVNAAGGGGSSGGGGTSGGGGGAPSTWFFGALLLLAAARGFSKWGWKPGVAGQK
jgi:sugar lactone lactonase YvrE